MWRFSCGGLLLAARTPAAGATPPPQPVWLVGIQPFTGGNWDAGISLRIGNEIILEEVARNPALLPGYELKVVWQDGLCNVERVTNLVLKNLYRRDYEAWAPGVPLGELDVDRDGTITTEDTSNMTRMMGPGEVAPAPVGLIGPGCSGAAYQIIPILYFSRMPVISGTTSFPGLGDHSKLPNFYRTMLPDDTLSFTWVALAKMLGHTRIVAVMGEIGIFREVAMAVVKAASELGVEMQGIKNDVQDFRGLQISFDSESAAKETAVQLTQLRMRIIVMLLYQRRIALVLCECYKQGFLGGVYQTYGWHAPGWWAREKTSCTPAQVTQMAVGYIGAKMNYWRSDGETPISCSVNMTADRFRREWYARQGIHLGATLSTRPEGYTPFEDAAPNADAMCMYALTLHELLIVQGLPLADLAARGPAAYEAFQRAFARTDFEGVSGRVRFSPGSGEVKGSVLVQQLHADGAMVDIATHSHPVFSFLGREDLVFQYAGERFFAGPAGAAAISANLSQYARCPEGQILDFSNNTCNSCPPSTQFAEASGRCICVAGFKDGGRAGGCVPCPLGSVSRSPDALTCEPCAPGRHSASEGATSCSYCPRGKFTLADYSAECADCPALHTTENIASTSTAECICSKGAFALVGGGCQACPSGATTASLSSSDRTACLCPAGTFMPDDYGHCTPCPGGSTTLGQGGNSISACLCREGHYMPLGAGGCSPCPKGMRCGQGSSEANARFLGLPGRSAEQQFPGLLPGHWASAEEPMAVFRCRDKRRCPGLEPGSACALGAERQACDHCASGRYWQGERCEKCRFADTSGLLFPMVPLVFLPLAVIFLYRISGDPVLRWGSRQQAFATFGAILLNYYQIVNLIAGTRLSLPVELQASFHSLDLTNNPAALFRAECALSSGLMQTIVMRAVAPIIVSGLLFLMFAASSTVSRVLNRPALKLDRDRLLCVGGAMLFTFFGAIAATSTLVFKCSGNPSGHMSLAMDLSVVCFTSSEWRSVLGVGVACVLVYIVGIGSVMVRQVYVAPMVFTSTNFQMRWKFLFIKFHSSAYWWGIVFLAKNFFVNLALALPVAAVAQLYMISVLISIYFAGIIMFTPYRIRIMNAFEALGCTCLLFLTSILTWYAGDDAAGSYEGFMSVVALVACFLPACALPVFAAYVWATGRQIPATPRQVRKFEEIFEAILASAEVLSSMDTVQGGQMLAQLGELEVYHLALASSMICTDVIGKKSSWRLVDGRLSLRSTMGSFVRTNSRRQSVGYWIQERSFQAEGDASSKGSAAARSGWWAAPEAVYCSEVI